MLGTIIVMLVAAGVFLAILFQGVDPDTIGDLQSCDEGVIASTAGPLLGDVNRMGCFSSRFEPVFPKGECTGDFESKNDSHCIASGEKGWQYLLKLGCPDEVPYCWAQTDEAISTEDLNPEEEPNQVNQQGMNNAGDPNAFPSP